MSLEHFIRFTTDIVGVERTLRLIQSSILVILSYPNLLALITLLLAYVREGGGGGGPPPKPDVVFAVLAGVNEKVNMTRRFLRFFRFVECLHRAQGLWEALFWDPPISKEEITPEKKKAARAKQRRLDKWLDAFGCSSMGLYLTLEAAIVLDMMHVPGLSVWGPFWTTELNREAMRFWMFALGLNAAATAVRIFRITHDVPLAPVTEEEKRGLHRSLLEEGPDVEDDYAQLSDEKSEPGGSGWTSEKSDNERSEENEKNEKNERSEKNEKNERSEEQTFFQRRCELIRNEQLRLRTMQRSYHRRHGQWNRAVMARLRTLFRKIASDCLDMLMPAIVVGWLHIDKGIAGIAMVITTLLTGYEVWKRCGAEVAAGKNKA